MTEALLEYETIDAAQIEDIMSGRKPQPPGDWNDSDDPKPKDGKEMDPDSRASGAVGGPAGEH